MSWLAIVRVGIVWGVIVRVGNCPGGNCPRGNRPGGNRPGGGIRPGGSCPGTIDSAKLTFLICIGDLTERAQ